MPLSVTKLQEIIKAKKLIPVYYFVNKDYNCIFVYVKNDKLSFFIYIPSKYDIHVEKNSDVIELTEFTNEETKDSSEQTIDKEYENGMSLKTENIELPETIVDTKLSSRIAKLKTNLEKIALTVKNLKYKFAISIKNIFVCINRNNEIVPYTLNVPIFNKLKKIYPVTDLEVFFETDNIVDEIASVKNGLMQIFNKTYNNHTVAIKELEKFSSYNFSDIQGLLTSYTNYVNRLEKLYEIVAEKEERYKNLHSDNLKNYQKKEGGIKGLFNDINSSYKSSSLLHDINDCIDTKKEIVNLLNELSEKRDDLIVNTNTIFFSNEVMVYKTLENLKKLSKYNSTKN